MPEGKDLKLSSGDGSKYVTSTPREKLVKALQVASSRALEERKAANLNVYTVQTKLFLNSWPGTLKDLAKKRYNLTEEDLKNMDQETFKELCLLLETRLKKSWILHRICNVGRYVFGASSAVSVFGGFILFIGSLPVVSKTAILMLAGGSIVGLVGAINSGTDWMDGLTRFLERKIGTTHETLSRYFSLKKSAVQLNNEDDFFARIQKRL